MSREDGADAADATRHEVLHQALLLGHLRFGWVLDGLGWVTSCVKDSTAAREKEDDDKSEERTTVVAMRYVITTRVTPAGSQIRSS